MNLTQTDASLVAAALSGDRAALGQIYDRYSNDIYSFAMSRLRNTEQAADATQETFLMVATRLSTLRQPERLRSWVFAIARNKIIDQARYAQRAHVDMTDSVMTEAAMIDHVDHGANLESVESAGLLWTAAGSLTERDRDLLELSVRHGLDGEDLADALGVAISHLHVLKSRMNDRLKKAVGSLLIARMGTEDCPELANLLRAWDGLYTLQVRSQVTRHVSDCDICDQKQAALIGRGMAFGMLPLVPAPPALRGPTVDAMADALGGGAGATDVSDAGGAGGGTDGGAGGDIGSDIDSGWRTDGFPIASDQVSKPAAVATASAGVGILAVVGLMLVAGIAVVSYLLLSGAQNTDGAIETAGGTIVTNSISPGGETTTIFGSGSGNTEPGESTTTGTDDTSTPETTEVVDTTTSSTTTSTTSTTASPGRLVVETPLVSFGVNPIANLVVVNTGGSPVPYTVAVTAPFGVAEPDGVLEPGATKTITLAVDRTDLQSGSIAGQATVSTATDNHAVELTAIVDTIPLIERMAVTRRVECGGTIAVSLLAFDDHGVTSVNVTWTGPGLSGGATLPGSGPTYSGKFGPLTATSDGAVTVAVTVTDTIGQTRQWTDKIEIYNCQ